MFWMTHTVPSFPDVNKPVWNPQNNNEGHLFLCLSVEILHLSSLLDTLYYEQPFVYHSNYPKYAFENETLLDKCDSVRKMKCKLHSVYIASTEVTTADGMTMSIISENYRLAADIASSWITEKFQTSFYSWNRRSTKEVAQIRDCYGNFQVENLNGPITMAGTTIQHSEDNSRWILSPKGVWCIISSHRPKIFEKVSGGAICIRNPQIVNWFKQAMQSSSVQRC
ncbi:hypothetical protein D918_04856 [Trichuris suis]|nr:hypothetical protein D918_04856 [Trichuris suis]